MAEYIRNPDDKSYRLVSLTYSGDAPNFRAFSGDSQKISYNKNQVLEIEKINGAKVLEYCFEREQVLINKIRVPEGLKIVITEDIPTAHLWLKSEEALYKIPSKLPVENGYQYFIMPTLGSGLTIEEDRYFAAAYSTNRR